MRPKTYVLLNKIDKQFQKALEEKEKERKAEEAAVEKNDPTTDGEESDNSFDVSNLKFVVSFLVKFATGNVSPMHTNSSWVNAIIELSTRLPLHE